MAWSNFPLWLTSLSSCRHARRLWRVEEDDQLPTLAELFQHLPEQVSFDIEVKMTTPDSAPCTEPAEVQRMADAILRVVQQERQRGDALALPMGLGYIQSRVWCFLPCRGLFQNRCRALLALPKLSHSVHLGVCCKPCLSHCLDEASAHHAAAQASPPYIRTLNTLTGAPCSVVATNMPSLIASWLCPADGGRRTILFSSFDPDMCAELASRQAAPVMLLSDGGLQLYADPRRNSIQAAIAFASSAGLKGVILETAALRQDQHCVEAAQNQGLKVSRGPVPDWHS